MNKRSNYISQEQQEIFERYLLGQMNKEEKDTFISKLEQDGSLTQQFQEFKMLFRTVEEDGLRQKLEELHNIVERPQGEQIKPPRISRIKILRIAASLAVLITLGGFWFVNRKSPTERLFDTYFLPDPGLPTVMGPNSDYSFYEAMVDYKQGNYDIAIDKWEKLLIEKPKNDTLNYFLGAAYLANGEHQKSIPLLMKITQKDSASFSKEALYYLGLVNLKENQKDDAIQNFEASKDNRSKILLSKLKK